MGSKRTWLKLARVEELPTPGSWKLKPLPIWDTSIILVRGEDGLIRGFHNTCSHRGNRVIWAEDGHGTAVAALAAGTADGAQGIATVVTRLQDAVIEAGYITTRVLAAPQDLSSGRLVLTVVPGRVHRIRLREGTSPQVRLSNALRSKQMQPAPAMSLPPGGPGRGLDDYETVLVNREGFQEQYAAIMAADPEFKGKFRSRSQSKGKGKGKKGKNRSLSRNTKGSGKGRDSSRSPSRSKSTIATPPPRLSRMKKRSASRPFW